MTMTLDWLDEIFLWSPAKTSHVAHLVEETCRDMLDECTTLEDLLETWRSKRKQQQPSAKKRKRPAEDHDDESEDLEPKELLKRARARFMEECLNNTNGLDSSSCVTATTPPTELVLPHEIPLLQQVYNQNGRIGLYSTAERQAILTRFREKRLKRNWDKTIRYNVRKSFADQRRRIKGRFVKHVVHFDEHPSSHESNGSLSHDSDETNTMEPEHVVESTQSQEESLQEMQVSIDATDNNNNVPDRAMSSNHNVNHEPIENVDAASNTTTLAAANAVTHVGVAHDEHVPNGHASAETAPKKPSLQKDEDTAVQELLLLAQGVTSSSSRVPTTTTRT